MKNITTTQLKHRLRERKIRQSDVARAIGCTQGHVSRLLSGETSEKSKTFQKIVRFLYRGGTEIAPEGKDILARLIDECWGGTLEQALIFDEIIRGATKLCYLD